jgi:hypothetical protein
MAELEEVMRFFEEVRASYVRTLEHAIRGELEKHPGARLCEEVVAKAEDSGYKTCWDMAVEHDDGRLEPMLVELEKFLPWEPARIQVGTVSVLVEPFLWHVCSVVARPPPAEPTLTALAEWFDRWFERPKRPGERFRNAVHWMSEPEIREGNLCVQIDLGSASAVALLDLLATLGAMGATSAAIHSAATDASPDVDLP